MPSCIRPEARAGGSSHNALSGGCGAIHHVDGGSLALGLHKRSADFGKIECRGFSHFAGRGDGISVIGAASSQHCALDDGDVAFTKLPHVRLLPALAPERLWGELSGGTP